MYYPKHVAIIPDGNRTRARANNTSIPEAYMISYQRGVDLLKYTFDNTDAKAFTLWGLSTENAKKRPKEEFDFLMTMYKLIDDDIYDYLKANKINFKRIGDPAGITEDFKAYLQEKERTISFDTDRYFMLGVNYGGRNEILRGIKDLANKGYDLTKITEKDLSNALELGEVPPIELVVRTKGDQAQRTSGFMSWWIGYAELYFTAKKCPELLPEDFQKALDWFDEVAQKRNFGK